MDGEIATAESECSRTRMTNITNENQGDGPLNLFVNHNNPQIPIAMRAGYEPTCTDSALTKRVSPLVGDRMVDRSKWEGMQKIDGAGDPGVGISTPICNSNVSPRVARPTPLDSL